jgi:hypothetical protein
MTPPEIAHVLTARTGLPWQFHPLGMAPLIGVELCGMAGQPLRLRMRRSPPGGAVLQYDSHQPTHAWHCDIARGVARYALVLVTPRATKSIVVGPLARYLFPGVYAAADAAAAAERAGVPCILCAGQPLTAREILRRMNVLKVYALDLRRRGGGEAVDFRTRRRGGGDGGGGGGGG